MAAAMTVASKWTASSSNPLATARSRLDPLEPALDRPPGLVVLAVEDGRPPAGLSASLAVGHLVGGLRDRAADSPLSGPAVVAGTRGVLRGPADRGADVDLPRDRPCRIRPGR
ncbi:hypothetical protein GCM10018784_62240 [Streptomyces hydrogenans]|nr:hypothetical protein GCM10018784_62240 [Streptomyces hydrogenans]